METIKVRINEDGITAKEVNVKPSSEYFQKHFPGMRSISISRSASIFQEIADDEEKLRTLEIDNPLYFCDPSRFMEKCISDGIFTAEILPNGKIKIID